MAKEIKLTDILYDNEGQPGGGFLTDLRMGHYNQDLFNEVRNYVTNFCENAKADANFPAEDVASLCWMFSALASHAECCDDSEAALAAEDELFDLIEGLYH